eukprot:scaffold2261_cov405-Prasinococcus_capsulatus_cf.AAC.21
MAEAGGGVRHLRAGVSRGHASQPNQHSIGAVSGPDGQVGVHHRQRSQRKAASGKQIYARVLRRDEAPAVHTHCSCATAQEETMGKTEVEEWLAEAQGTAALALTCLLSSTGEQQPVATPEGGPGVRQLPQDVPEEEGYVQIGSKQLVGIYLTVWMKASLWSHTNHIEVLTIGCGALGFLGNKGAVCLRFSLYNTSLCFVCAHLSSGESHGTERRRDAEVADILDRAVFSDVDISTWTFSELLAGPVPTTILAHDVAIWIGDLNYRIDLDNLVIHEAIGRRDWEFLFEAEQLQVQKAAGMVFQGWNEGPIDFQPTYRFRIGQDTYCGDGTGPEGEKKRRPAWCDRILYRGREIEQLTYSMTDVRSSDHRPVSSVFLASLKEIIPHKLEDVRHELRRKLDHYEMTIQPQCSVEPVLVEIGEVLRNVRFEEPNVGKVTVKNIGDVLAKIQFLNFPGTERICPSWIRVSPTGCAVDMGCSQDINLTVMVESAEESQQLYEQNGMIDEVLVLHIEGGRDFFVRVQGTFELTCFGLSIEKQLDLAQPVRSRGPAPLIDLAPTTRTIPHAMDELTAWLLQMERLREPDLFLGQEEGSGVGGISTIRDLLDEGETLPTDTAPGEALASLIHWLECLPTPLIPTTALYRWGNGGKGFMEKAVHFLQQEAMSMCIHLRSSPGSCRFRSRLQGRGLRRRILCPCSAARCANGPVERATLRRSWTAAFLARCQASWWIYWARLLVTAGDWLRRHPAEHSRQGRAHCGPDKTGARRHCLQVAPAPYMCPWRRPSSLCAQRRTHCRSVGRRNVPHGSTLSCQPLTARVTRRRGSRPARRKRQSREERVPSSTGRTGWKHDGSALGIVVGGTQTSWPSVDAHATSSCKPSTLCAVGARPT